MFWNLTIPLENEAVVVLRFLTTTTSLSVTFANTTRIIQPNSIKVTIEIFNWPFNSLRNHLSVAIALSPDKSKLGDCNYNITNTDKSGTTRWIVIVVNDVPLYGNFLNYAVIDQEKKPIQVNYADSLLYIIIPHFWVSAVIDPDFSVLLGPPTDSSNPCGDKIKKHSSTYKAGVIVGIVLGVVVAIVIIGGLLYFSYRKRKYRREIREKYINAGMEMNQK